LDGNEFVQPPSFDDFTTCQGIPGDETFVFKQTLTILLIAFTKSIPTIHQYHFQVMAEEEPMGCEFSKRW